MAAFKLQSAMEYLMTYGWAILIIAVVLGALFELGFFNSSSLAPTIPAGACQVYRPQGPGTTAFINTEGTCNGELPQDVAKFSGGSQAITISGLPTSPTSPNNDVTITFWMYLQRGSSSGDAFGFTKHTILSLPYIGLQSASSFGQVFVADSSTSNLFDTWSFIAFSYNGSTGTGTLYVNGAQAATGAATYFTPNQAAAIGNREPGGSVGFNGLISNVQLYNSTLSANQIQAMYTSGIGGVPIVLNNLVAWWPLNGNANDYGGSQYNGAPGGVVFTTSWKSSYTAP